IWMSGGGLASDGPNRIFFSTGNGYGNPYGAALPGNAPPGDLEEAVGRLNVAADGKLSAVDFFAPHDAIALNGADADLGAGTVVMLPPELGTAALPHLAVVAGKGQNLYLLNRDNLGGFGGVSAADRSLQTVAIGGSTWSRAAVWPANGGYVYVTVNGGGSGVGF